jgi:hypothetical protein
MAPELCSFELFAPFCGNSAQVAFHQQLTTQIVLFQLRLIKPTGLGRDGK